MKLESVTVETGAAPTCCVIWLHGLGADGHDFEPVVPQLKWAEAPDVRYIFPHAPIQPVTINGGMQMRAWYDILGLDLESRVDEGGIRASAGQVQAILDEQIEKGISSDRIVLAGFSQGGAVALMLGLTYAKPLAGIIALSTYLPLTEQLEDERSTENANTPIFWGHGRVDPVVAYGLGEMSAARLRQWGYSVGWHDYPVAHGVHPQEISDLRDWLQSCLDRP
ncbi:MAG: alpha/beta fold hydrolase [Pseudomonadota bacterium]